MVHRIDALDRADFGRKVTNSFGKVHSELKFDLVESPEIGAEAAQVASAFPSIAVVCKLHTPSYLVNAIGHEKISLSRRIRFRLGALRRGRWAGLKQIPYRRDCDLEWQFSHQADEIAAPSQAIADRLIADWGLDPSRISVFPLPFRPDPDLLELAIPDQVRTIGFLGRMETRKGVVELARAIPSILKRAPQLRFRFLGPSWPYRNVDMETWIRRHCRSLLDRITFVGAVSRSQLACELGHCDVVVLPSRWENFPFACWEAMASGRVVIGSSAGGMAEVIQPSLSGLLVPPRSPEAITAAVLSLVEHPERVASLAAAGRQRVLEHLSPERILPLQLASYERAIARARQRR